MIKNEKDNVEITQNLPQSPTAEQGAEAQREEGLTDAENLGKFKNVDALLRAYNSLQAEFTRRSQRLKELEKDREQNTPSLDEKPVSTSTEDASTPLLMPENKETSEDELYLKAKSSDKVKAKIISDYLAEVKKSAVPLMGGGVSVISPATRAKSVLEAGAMALGYFKNSR